MNDNIKDRAKDLDRKNVDKENIGTKQYGEGNHKASRQFNDASKEFVRSGQVPTRGNPAAPREEAEARELRDAERDGRKRAREEEPMLHAPGAPRRPDSEPPQRHPDPRKNETATRRK